MACGGDSPTQPSRSSSPSITRLEIGGPGSVAPGASEQFTVRAHLTDGSTTLVTNEATWTSSNASVLSVSAGLVTGVERGEADLRVSYAGRSSTKHLMVLPAGTFKLSVMVHDGGFGLTNARVEVTAGSATGLVATSTGPGTYALYGVAGDTELRITRDDYEPRVENLFVADHRTLDIELVPSGGRVDPTGTYTLTVEAAPECRSSLPATALTRTYSATIAGNGSSNVIVTLGGANFLTTFSTANSFHGRLGAGRVSFTLWGPSNYYFYYYLASVMEQIAPSAYFVPSGKLEAEPSATGFSGALDGTIEIREGTNVGSLSVTASCRSANHRFTFAH
ncbi:MAG TPA: Ig-like domain-containing protein [Vicinamibacterales bacterium]|nr:Ig-like domain-containing protein [Vicinamibacterales bacterium]